MAGTPQFTHASLDDFRILKANLSGGRRSTRDRLIPRTTFLGVDLAQVISTVQTAMMAGLPYTALRDMMVTHPTMTEGLNLLFAAVTDA